MTKVENEEEMEIMRSKVIRDLSLVEKGVEKINKVTNARRSSGREENDSRFTPHHTSQFHGDSLEWRGFWDPFEVLVDTQPIPLVTKITHLASCLHGKAKEAIAGLPITNESYQEAKQVLTKKFGNSAIVKRHLYRTLQTLPICSDKTSDLKRFHDALSQACRELRAPGEPLDNLPLVLSLLQKFPATILEEMTRDKVAQELDMELIKEGLDKYLTKKEEFASLLDSERRTSGHTELQKRTANFATALAVEETNTARGCIL
ncbi:unnamed protein product [Toxocara canis]|uniref:Uncharacterized protein n=1 Tax=Toxocara canis TaxID=6265 RepID=A0A183UBN4_TOXCA|nr:unnamed protein product [Toxocara canis]